MTTEFAGIPPPRADIDDGDCEARPGWLLVLSVTYDQAADVADPNLYYKEHGADWQLASFCRNHRAFVHPDDLDVRDPASMEAEGLIYRLDCYQHGGCTWSMHGEGMQCQFDTAHGGGVLVWRGQPAEYRDAQGRLLAGAELRAKREERARWFLGRYNAWVNGRVYLLDLRTCNEEADPIVSIGPFFEDELDSAVCAYVLPELEGRRVVAASKSDYDITKIKELAPHLDGARKQGD